MPSSEKRSADPLTTGERVKWHRERRGMRRKALAELVGRSEEWLRLLEVEGRGAERLSNLVDIARALGMSDASMLVGFDLRPRSTGGVPEHPAVAEVRLALSLALLAPAVDGPRCTMRSLQERVQHAWNGWRMSRAQYIALGAVLPDLLTDAIALAHWAPEIERRAAHKLLTHVYLLAQRFAFCVSATSLATRCTDRALLAADQADDPELLALAGWAAAMTSLAADEPGEAAAIALCAREHVPGTSTPREAALRGSLLLFAAIGAARVCRPADAWRYWDEAARIAEQLHHGYQHPHTQFSSANVAVYGVALHVETGNAIVAADKAARLDPSEIPSTNRRAQHFIDVARSHHRAGNAAQVLPALLASVAESRETIVYSSDARDLVLAQVRASKPDQVPQLAQLAHLLDIA
ncbi:transcriptional regulator with XRE-family HTH domain [Catenulispora sp. GAS73]|uniref:helix-turn-helix domain-containing protein n=1 Tax=Catenulispora sp. GAS73 TaxID=3156269 RepID=UPI0035198508